MDREIRYIGMLAYTHLLQWLPEDGTSMQKHVEVDVCHKRRITGRIIWMVYCLQDKLSHSKQILQAHDKLCKSCQYTLL
jgi:hypothetical protein